MARQGRGDGRYRARKAQMRRGVGDLHTRRLRERRCVCIRGRAVTVFVRADTDLRRNFACCVGEVVGRRRGGCEQHTRRLAERRGGGRRGRAATVFGRGGTDLRQNFARCGGDIVGR